MTDRALLGAWLLADFPRSGRHLLLNTTRIRLKGCKQGHHHVGPRIIIVPRGAHDPPDGLAEGQFGEGVRAGRPGRGGV